jgi:hypothetical protein
MESLLLDAAGHRRSPATLPGYHQGRAPRNKGLRYPADPPTIEEIMARIDQDRELGEPGGEAAGDADPGTGLTGARCLPEDPFAAALDAGEHRLGAVLPRAVEHQVDRDTAALA